MLSNAGVIENAHAADGESLGRNGSDGKSTRASIENDAVHFDGGRKGGVRVTRAPEAGYIRGAIRHGRRRPIIGRVPIGTRRMCAPGSAAGMGIKDKGRSKS